MERHVKAVQEADENRELRKAAGAESMSTKQALSIYGGDDE